MSGADHLSVRLSQRHDVALCGRFKIAESHAEIVRFASASGVRNGAIESDVIDLSEGGLSLLSSVYIPKRVKIDCQVLLPADGTTAFEVVGVVSRAVMTDRRPMYLIGVSFEKMTDASRSKLSTFLAELGEVG